MAALPKTVSPVHRHTCTLHRKHSENAQNTRTNAHSWVRKALAVTPPKLNAGIAELVVRGAGMERVEFDQRRPSESSQESFSPLCTHNWQTQPSRSLGFLTTHKPNLFRLILLGNKLLWEAVMCQLDSAQLLDWVCYCRCRGVTSYM